MTNISNRKNQRHIFIFIFLFTLLLGVFEADAQVSEKRSVNADPEKIKFATSDIALFWAAYDKAKPENDLVVFRDEYLKKGSAGLRKFTDLRIENACQLVDSISAAPKYYAALREPSLKIGSYENQMRANFRKFKEIYPAAVFPDVYFVVGRMNSAGTLSDTGLLIGVDMFGKNANAPTDELSAWHKAVVGEMRNIPFIVAHESIHYQQTGKKSKTLLARALNEGVADFVGEMISGGNINQHLHEYGKTREKELWLAFRKEMDGEDFSKWLYQGDKATDRPADLGYYVGYKIAESYYQKHSDKKQALADILVINDPNAFLKASGYEQKFSQ